MRQQQRVSAPMALKACVDSASAHLQTKSKGHIHVSLTGLPLDVLFARATAYSQLLTNASPTETLKGRIPGDFPCTP